jgi:two-component system, LytTR family, sensor kinase
MNRFVDAKLPFVAVRPRRRRTYAGTLLLRSMKWFSRHERVRLYVQISGAFLALGVLGDLLYDPALVLPKLANHLWLLTYLTTLNYLLYDHLIPAIRPTWRRVLLGIGLFWACVIACSFGLYAWRAVGIGLHLYTDFSTTDTTNAVLKRLTGYSVGTLFFFGIIRYTYDFRRLKETAQQLRIEKQQAELNYLKAQTNPHFLFNTLNNIYALTRDKSEQAPAAVLRLSELLRYMLYETSGQYVLISNEVAAIGHYLTLERLRYDDTLRLTFTTDLDNPAQRLPPLLLMPLVENAFKHGVSETRTQPFVHIQLTVRQQRLLFSVRNSADNTAEPAPVNAAERIGLPNLRRQLELLYNDFSLTTTREASVFVATLTINLASHG